MFSWKIHLVIQRPIRPTLQDGDDAHYVTSHAHAAAQKPKHSNFQIPAGQKTKKKRSKLLNSFWLGIVARETM